MIPSRDNYVEWFTCAARFHFLREGYAFLSFGIDQVPADGFPLERLLRSGNVLVGFEFVRPAAGADAKGGTFEGDPARHATMADAGNAWAYYALPQFADALDQQLTHQKVAFATASNVVLSSAGVLEPRETHTFKQLVERMEEGSAGYVLSESVSLASFESLLEACGSTLYLVLGRASRIVFALKSASDHESR